MFEGLERNLLPPSQIQISPKLTDDATLIYRNNGGAGRGGGDRRW